MDDLEAARREAREWNAHHGVGTRVRYRIGNRTLEAQTCRPALGLTGGGRGIAAVYVPEVGAVGGVRSVKLGELEVVRAEPAQHVPAASTPEPTVPADMVAALESARTAAAERERAPLPKIWQESHFVVAPGEDRLLKARAVEDLRPCDCDGGFRHHIGAAYGQPSTIPCWRCVELKLREDAFNALGLRAGGKRAAWTLGGLDWTLVLPLGEPPPMIAGARHSTPGAWLRAWAQAWAPTAPGALLGGGTGRGKSHIAAGLQRWFALVRGVRSAWAHWPVLMERLKATFNDGAPETKAEVYAPLLSVPLVVLDDLKGQETARGMSQWAQQELALLLEQLGESGATLIVTTNVASYDDFVEGVGEAAASRLAEMCAWVGIGGEDYRRRSGGQARAEQPTAPARPAPGLAPPRRAS